MTVAGGCKGVGFFFDAVSDTDVQIIQSRSGSGTVGK